MPSRRSSHVVAACSIAFLFLGATACGGDDDKPAKSQPSPSKVVVTGPGSDPSENFDAADKFAQALAGHTSADIAKAQALVAPKSAAARYLATLEADDASAGPDTVTEDPQGSYKLCPVGDGTCTEITELVLLDGKVTTFKVDGKQLR